MFRPQLFTRLSISAHHTTRLGCQLTRYGAIVGIQPGYGIDLRSHPVMLSVKRSFHLTQICDKDKDKRQKKGKTKKGVRIEEDMLLDEEVASIINVSEMKREFDVALEHLEQDFIQQLALRTSTAAFHNLQVRLGPSEKCLLGELGSVFMKTPTLCVINLTSPQHCPAVVEALQASALNVNPQVDGTVVSLSLPKVTKEHREQLSKTAKILFNRCKDHLRSIHNTYDKKVRKQEAHHSKDTLINISKNIQTLYEEYVAKAETMMKHKQAELLQH